MVASVNSDSRKRYNAAMATNISLVKGSVKLKAGENWLKHLRLASEKFGVSLPLCADTTKTAYCESAV